MCIRDRDADTKLVVALELGPRAAQRIPHREIERVSLRRAIEPDDKHVTATLGGDGPDNCARHAAELR